MGVEVDPEHGVGYDFILSRRIWQDINIKVDFFHYEIKDYVVSRNYSKYGGTPPIYGNTRMNLEKVHKNGVEVELNGHILDDLSLYVSYAYHDWESKGPEPQGAELGDRAKNRVTAGLRYNLFENTLLMLDYKFQDEQISHVNEEVPPNSGNWVCYDYPIDAYHVFDFGIEQTLFKNRRFIKDAVLTLYVNNLFDSEYENAEGFPMADRTFGAGLRFRF